MEVIPFVLKSMCDLIYLAIKESHSLWNGSGLSHDFSLSVGRTMLYFEEDDKKCRRV